MRVMGMSHTKEEKESSRTSNSSLYLFQCSLYVFGLFYPLCAFATTLRRMAGLGVIGITEATWQMIAQSPLMAYDEYSKMVGTIGAWVRHVPPQHHQRTREYLTGAATCATLTKMMYELVNTTHPDKQKADLKRVALWLVVYKKFRSG